jgi:AraC-like DNA-binding protein
MIGKTRQAPEGSPSAPRRPRSPDLALDCGVLKHAASPGTYRHTRYPPCEALSDWVQHFWVESWDLRDQASQVREVLPHPCVHLALARGRSRVYGVQLQRMSRKLEGRDCIVGVKFRPGAFYPFLRRPVLSLANKSMPASELLRHVADAEQALPRCGDDEGLVEVASRLLLDCLPPTDTLVEAACAATEQIRLDRSITRVEHLISRCDMSERTLQRLFSKYVGASARWVIKRYRVFEALNRFEAGGEVGFAALAQDLGYYDQAHFIKDFKKLIGQPPAAYLKT